ncbi:MAG: Rpn family recombination-promoting nuclease/putative transposase [Myxococcaceae bacterium]|nr:Rpn family recombination-promoting nuclease/putative transposase [Myxococcaceae bacterium]MBH2006809.1 Rpn family recombination-promoting nuclease/putative transposase [Myxococcaceae bacterium]
MQRYLDPTNDVGFKKVFGDPIRMMDFLNNILRLSAGKRIQKVEFVPTEQIPDLGQGKRSLFDLKCQDESGTYFLIEMQCRRSPIFLKRMQYYGAHAYTSQIQAGKKHADLLPVVVVAVLKESILPSNIEAISYHRTLEEKTGQHHLRELSYVFVELEKFHKTEKELLNFEDEWLFFLRDAHTRSHPPLLKDLCVSQAFEAMERANWTPEEYDAYVRARLLLETEELSAKEQFDLGMVEGEAIGLEKGKPIWTELANLQTARNLLILKVDKPTISKATGFSLEKIEQLEESGSSDSSSKTQTD